MSWNPYPYAFGNPVNYTDPSGEFPWLVAAAAVLGVATYNAGRNFLKQAVENLQNGRLPLECIDGNEIVDAFLDGFILGSGIIIVGAMAGIGVAGLVGGILGGSKAGFIVAGIMAGALLTGAENLKNQVDKIIGEGRADNFWDALNKVNPLDVLVAAGLGATAGMVLGFGWGNSIGRPAWLGLFGYGVGIVGYNLGKDEDARISFSIRDASVSILTNVGLSFLDSRITGGSTIHRSPLSRKRLLLMATGAGSAITYSVLTDDDPFHNILEVGIIGLYGFANGVLGSRSGISDFLGGVTNGIINGFSNDFDTR